ncbi:Taurine catabolism dioxygenase [Fusarium beomiforme]|uniref:Taurine catabolism dioxygenase n=1 Tax=Fusarium beomiforme TaxID=44412 RepID=A0A9P5ADI8_9HYPO|nr:Taurine catabolism dioxygenase [Fusarium beomiforme]
MTHRLSGLTRFGSLGVPSPFRLFRSHGTLALPHRLRVLNVPHMSWARHLGHVEQVAAELETTGLLKIRLGFPDVSSDYLKQLLLGLHKHHYHHLPITHSATRGWFWDVRPKATSVAGAHQARSETMSEFSWHTDCSYEDPLPRYFALQVLQHDRYGGGTLSAMNVDKLMENLPTEARETLMAPEFRIQIPPEFIKDPMKTYITGSILASVGSSVMIRYRGDIVTPQTARAAKALGKLEAMLARNDLAAHSTIRFGASDLPKGSIILMDNRRWLHARNGIRDPERHLRRVRWDARPFDRTE